MCKISMDKSIRFSLSLMFLVSLLIVGVVGLNYVEAARADYYFNPQLSSSSPIILNDKMEVTMEEKYQGPVRPTDDLEYFRKTGITKPLEVKR